VLAALAVIADLALERLAGAELPTIGGNRATTRLVLASIAAACVLLKFLFHVHFGWFGGGFWGGAVLAAVLVVAAKRARDTEQLAGPGPVVR
jgi:hypothetical protein